MPRYVPSHIRSCAETCVHRSMHRGAHRIIHCSMHRSLHRSIHVSVHCSIHRSMHRNMATHIARGPRWRLIRERQIAGAFGIYYLQIHGTYWLQLCQNFCQKSCLGCYVCQHYLNRVCVHFASATPQCCHAYAHHAVESIRDKRNQAAGACTCWHHQRQPSTAATRPQRLGTRAHTQARTQARAQAYKHARARAHARTHARTHAPHRTARMPNRAHAYMHA